MYGTHLSAATAAVVVSQQAVRVSKVAAGRCWFGVVVHMRRMRIVFDLRCSSVLVGSRVLLEGAGLVVRLYFLVLVPTCRGEASRRNVRAANGVGCFAVTVGAAAATLHAPLLPAPAAHLVLRGQSRIHNRIHSTHTQHTRTQHTQLLHAPSTARDCVSTATARQTVAKGSHWPAE